MPEFFWLVPLGFVIGVYGTLIGAGGGFFLIPSLIFLYPQQNTELITSISLAVIFVNALSGSVAYARMGRIDYKSGVIFSLATIPGAIVGAFSTAYILRRVFDPIFGALLITVSIFLIVKPELKETTGECNSHFCILRNIKEKNGVEHAFSYNYLLGVSLSLLTGFISSILGVGGGIIHVPALIYLMNFPTHIATATSHFILTVTAGTATCVHMATGTFFNGMGQVLPLALGVLFGAPLGARLSCRIQDYRLMQALAFAIILVGMRIIMAVL